MEKYMAKAKGLLARFPTVRIVRIPRAENVRADALARLVSVTRTELRRIVFV